MNPTSIQSFVWVAGPRLPWAGKPFSHTSRTGAASACPSGCGRLARRANFRFAESPNQWLTPAIPFRQEGRTRRHERGTGCGGRESVGAPLMSQGELNLVSDF